MNQICLTQFPFAEPLFPGNPWLSIRPFIYPSSAAHQVPCTPCGAKGMRVPSRRWMGVLRGSSPLGPRPTTTLALILRMMLLLEWRWGSGIFWTSVLGFCTLQLLNPLKSSQGFVMSSQVARESAHPKIQAPPHPTPGVAIISAFIRHPTNWPFTSSSSPDKG